MNWHPKCLALTADLERYEDCQRVVARAVEHFGRLDILINNVGGTIWAKPFEHYLPAEIEAEVRSFAVPDPLVLSTARCRTCWNKAAG